MKNVLLPLLCAILFPGCNLMRPENNSDLKTICNPVDISYRYQPDKPSRREAADPTAILFRDVYYLFASKSGGYWYSDDLASWTFIGTNEIPTEEYAPTVVSIGDTLYFLASSTKKSTIYKTTDPKSGHWDIACDSLAVTVWDPALFLDDDQRLYLYWGCSDVNPIYGIELDYKDHFKLVGESIPLIYGNPSDHGWEVPGDYNTNYKNSPWIEGAWMNKHDGTYYLQYAGPGTEFKSYADAVYTSSNPLGPFKTAAHNPFSYKPEGFAAGAGHGSTFMDRHGNYWHIATSTISVRHIFERRLGLYPAFFDNDGILYSDTRFGDYPLIIPQKQVEDFQELFPGWMLLSYDKPVTVSSSEEGHPPRFMTDENIRTCWAAQSGDDTEWADLDLESRCDVYAIQVDFADVNTSIFGRQPGLCYRYIVEGSADNKNWDVIIDKSENTTDNSQDYTQLKKPVSCRFLRIRNISVPGGYFALSGFRAFGNGSEALPGEVESFVARRNPADPRSVRLSWNPAKGAEGYNVSYGPEEHKLYENYMVYGDTTVTINNLNAGQDYYFTVQSFNPGGISERSIIKAAAVNN